MAFVALAACGLGLSSIAAGSNWRSPKPSLLSAARTPNCNDRRSPVETCSKRLYIVQTNGFSRPFIAATCKHSYVLATSNSCCEKGHERLSLQFCARASRILWVRCAVPISVRLYLQSLRLVTIVVSQRSRITCTGPDVSATRATCGEKKVRWWRCWDLTY